MKYLKKFSSQDEHDRCLGGEGEYQFPSVSLILPDDGVGKKVNFLNGHHFKQIFFGGGGSAANDKSAFASFKTNGTEEMIKKNEIIPTENIDVYLDTETLQAFSGTELASIKLLSLCGPLQELIGSSVIFDNPIPENTCCVLLGTGVDFLEYTVVKSAQELLDENVLEQIDTKTFNITDKVCDYLEFYGELCGVFFIQADNPEEIVFDFGDMTFFTQNYTHRFVQQGKMVNAKSETIRIDATDPDLDMSNFPPKPNWNYPLSGEKICRNIVIELDEPIDPATTMLLFFLNGEIANLEMGDGTVGGLMELGLATVSDDLKTVDLTPIYAYLSLMLLMSPEEGFISLSTSLCTPLSDTEFAFWGGTVKYLSPMSRGLEVSSDTYFANIQWKRNTIPDKLFQGSVVTGFSDGAFDYFTRFGASAFENSQINSITLPDTLKYLGDRSFANCQNLREFTLGANAVNVDFNSVFTGTTKIDNFSISPANRRYDSRDNCNAVVDTLANTIVKGFENSTCPGTIKSIGTEAFKGLSSLTQFTLGSSVESIGDSAFSGCTSLKSIVIPDNVKTIGNSAYTSCSSATVLTLGNGLETIGDRSFYYCSNLSAITIPSNVKNIGAYAFSGCSKVKTVTIEPGIENIGDSTFYSLNGLTSVNIPGTVKTIGDHAFGYCNNLAEITLGEGVESIGKWAFSSAKKITNLTIPGSVKTIGDQAFGYCDILSSVTLTNGVTTIEANAFYDCPKLSSINIPNSVRYIGPGAFSACNFPVTNTYFTYADTYLIKCNTGCTEYHLKSLKSSLRFVGSSAFSKCSYLSAVTLPSGVCQIGEYAFNNCNLTAFTTPTALKRIEHGAFSGCTKMNKVILNEGLEYIGQNAFSESTNLCRLSLPESLTTLDSSAFAGMRSLQEIHIPSGVTKIIENPVRFANGLQKLTIDPNNPVYTDGNCNCIIEKATNKLKAGTTNGLIPNNVTSIGVRAFNNNFIVDNIVIPDSVIEIDDYSFIKCYAKHITFGSNVRSIGKEAFSECTKMQEIILPDSLTSLGQRAFADCISAKNLYLGSNLTGITESSFSKCRSLSSVTIPDSVTEIRRYAFSGCLDLTDVKLGANINNIDNYAFENCTSLSSITMSDNVTYIGEYAFRGCRSLTSITIPDSLTYLGYHGVFENCINLSEVTIGNCEAEITYSTFKECGALETISSNNPKYSVVNDMLISGNTVLRSCKYANVIPDIVLDIDKYAFSKSQIESIEIPGRITKLNDYTFYGCDRLKHVVFNEGLQTIDNYTFDGCINLFELTLPSTVTKFSGSAPQLRRIYSYAQTPPTVNWNSFYYTKTKGVYYYPIEADYSAWSSGSNGNSYGPGKEQSWVGFVMDDSEVDMSLGEYNIVCGYNVNTTTESTALIHNYSDIVKMEIDGIVVDPVSVYTFTTLGKHIVKYQATNISPNMFSGKTRMYKCVLGEGFTEIGAYAFKDCYGLEEIPNIPSTVTHIQNYAFYNTNGDYEGILDLPENLVYIGSYAFSKAMFKKVNIKSNVTDIQAGAFSGVTPLVSVVINNSPVTIQSGAFSDCNNLEHLDLGANVVIANANIVTSKKLSTDDGVVYIGNTALYTTRPQDEVIIKDGTTHISPNFKNSLSAKRIVIPDSVTKIENQTFANNSSIKEVVIGNNVEEIGSYAFSGCTSITRVTIPDSVKTIGSNAFKHCSGITEITLGSGLEEIGVSAFQLATHLTAITIPSGVTKIGNSAFTSTWALTDVTFENCECSLGESVFAYAEKLKNFSFGAKDTNIPYGMFRECNNLCELTIPESITSWNTSYWLDGVPLNRVNINTKDIPGSAFKNKLSLTDVVLGDTVETVGNNAFANCEYLSALTMTDNIKEIGTSAFSGCTSLVEVILPDTIENVWPYAFKNCNCITTEDGMQYVNNCLLGPVNRSQTGYTIKDNVINIGGMAFESCKSLKEIVIPDTVKFVSSKAFYNCQNATAITIGTGVTRVGTGAFQQCYKIPTVIIPDNVTTIDTDAFKSCTGLSEVIIGSGVETIGSGAFSSCKSLSSVTMGENVKNVDSDLFYGCTSLTNIVEMPESMTNIANSMYYGCTSLSSITIPEHVTQIGSYGFAQCSGISEITLGSNLTHIGGYAFSGCTSITNVVIPDNVISMGIYAFAYCTGLTDITIGSGVTGLGDNVFANCTSLSSVTIPDNVTSIGSSAFMNCTSLSSVTIPDSVTSIGYSAFTNCANIIDLTLGSGITAIRDKTFMNCTSLSSVTIPDSVTSIGYSAFTKCHSLQKITCLSQTAPTIYSSTFSGTTDNVTVYYPTGSDYSSWANLHPNWTFLPNLRNLECVSLSITADDVVGNATSTTIYYAATMQGVNNLGELETYTETGKTASDVFPQNTSETDTVVRTITFEYYGMTATTTITQGGWVNHNYTITLNDQWRKSTTVANPDETLYDGVYESFSNINVDSSEAVAYIDIAGYDEFSMYIRSYGENNYDYVMVSELDQNITRDTSYSNTTYVKGHTRGKSTSGNAVSNYTKVTWTGIDMGPHRITVLYGKDSSSKSGTDQGYFFIPKQ